jgi:hypothetical protein
MRILVACEFSGRVREAFRKKGHFVVSCDLIPSEDNSIFHFQRNVYDMLTMEWDMLIAFPPCTYLASSGARWFKERTAEQADSVNFVRNLMSRNIDKICIENPIGVLSTKIRKPDQIIQPWQFGHGETKATCLWLKNLPKLQPTNIVDGREPKVHYASPSKERWKVRSRTYTGIAEAMAEQWSQ